MIPSPFAAGAGTPGASEQSASANAAQLLERWERDRKHEVQRRLELADRPSTSEMGGWPNSSHIGIDGAPCQAQVHNAIRHRPGASLCFAIILCLSAAGHEGERSSTAGSPRDRPRRTNSSRLFINPSPAQPGTGARPCCGAQTAEEWRQASSSAEMYSAQRRDLPRTSHHKRVSVPLCALRR